MYLDMIYICIFYLYHSSLFKTRGICQAHCPTRKLKAMAEPPAAPAEATAGRWMASTVEELKKGHVICYQLET